jgi:hypothetical protein
MFLLQLNAGVAAAVQVTHYQKRMLQLSNVSDAATIQRLKRNEFLCASGKSPVKMAKKDWEHLSMRTKNKQSHRCCCGFVSSHCTKKSRFPLESSEEF